MDALLKTILEAPLPNVLIFAGLIFVGVSVLGGISGKLEPGKQGRIAAGVIGGVLLLVGIYFYVSGAGLSQAARTAATSPLDAPLPNLLIVAGLLFVGIGVLGGISGKFEPDRQGRIAAGAVGGLLLLIGFVMVLSGANTSQAARPLTPAPGATAVAALETVAAPSAVTPSATPAPTVAPTVTPLSSATPVPIPNALPSPTAEPSNIMVPRRDLTLTIAANGDLIFDDYWTVQFGPRSTRLWGLSFSSGTADKKIDSWTVAEGPLAYAENGARQADHTFDVAITTNSDGSRRYDVLWYFPSTANLVRNFVLHYVWHGSMTVTNDGLVVVRWRALGPGRNFLVSASRIVVKLPRVFDPAQLSATSTLNGVEGPGARAVDGQTVEFTGQNFAPAATWDVQVRYPQP